MVCWEYLQFKITFNEQNFIEPSKLDDLGREGWELVQVLEVLENIVIAIFKREKEDNNYNVLLRNE